MRTTVRVLVSVAALAGASVSGAPATQVESVDEALHLVLLLHLDERANSVRDTANEDIPITVEGAVGNVAGRFGTAFGFDGVDDFVTADETLCFSSQTIELWVRPAADGQGGILSSQAKPGRSSWRWRLARNADRSVSFHLHDNTMAPDRDREARSSATLDAGVWTHVAVTVDTGVSREAVLYINGQREAAVSVHQHHPYGNLFLGTSTTEGYFAGAIDEVAIFDRALTAEMIARHARATEPLQAYAQTGGGTFVLRPISDTVWFTFRHKDFGRNRWIFRMPEYMVYDEESQRHHIPYGVEWDVNRERTELRFRCGLPEETKQTLCLDFSGAVSAQEDTIDYELTVRNVGAEQWGRQRMLLFCLQCYRAEGMRDYEATRTFVHRDGQWVSMNEVVEGTFESHRMCGVGVRQGQKAGYERLAARVSEDATSVLGIATDNAVSLSFNFQDSAACLHSNPSWGLLKPGEEATAKGKIYLLKGTLDDLWQRYRTDFLPESGQ